MYFFERFQPLGQCPPSPKIKQQNLPANTEYGICSKAVIIGILRGEFTGFMACKAASEFANKTHLKICSKRR